MYVVSQPSAVFPVQRQHSTQPRPNPGLRVAAGWIRDCPGVPRVMTIHGLGVITSTAMAAETGGRVERFADARQFAASIGITPKENSTGETWRLGPITKRGNPYLRRLLVQCAQSVIQNCRSRPDAISKFAMRLLDDKHKRHNTVVVAVANHLARIVYAVIKHAEDYRPEGRAAART